MTARQRKTAEPTPEPTEQAPEYSLEPLDDDTRSRLNVWGNSTQIAINQLRDKAPGWAQMLDDIFAVVGQAIQEHS